MENADTLIQSRCNKTKTQILASGLTLFGRKGLYGTNSREIAAAAGVSVGSFYTYFKDKRHLFIELISDHCHKILEVLNNFQIADYLDKDPRQAVHALITDVWALYDSVHPLNQKAMALRESDPEIARILDEQENAVVERMLFLLDAAGHRLRVGDTRTAAWLVEKIIVQMIHGASLTKQPSRDNRVKDELVDMICRYLFK